MVVRRKIVHLLDLCWPERDVFKSARQRLASTVVAHLKKPMTQRIILSIVAIIMLALTIRKGDKWTILLTSGLAIGILMTWTEVPAIITSGLVIYMLTALMITISNLRTNELSRLDQATIVLTGIWAFGVNLFSIMNWPFTGIQLSMIIPIILYIFSLVKGMIRRKEFGYLTIMNVEFVLRLIR